MKILYLSCHEILEFDEVRLFHEMGHEVFSPGAYVCPDNKGDQGMRPSIPGLKYDPEIASMWAKHDAVHPSVDGKSYLTKEIVDKFDVVIVMHIPDWISKNWEVMKHKTVIWRTIGQSLASTEQQLAPYRNQGLKVVRYSPRETNIPGFIGQDALIRFYKDPNDYKDWNGKKKNVVTFAQHMEARASHCNYNLFESATRPFSRKLFGPGNNQPGFGMGKVPYSQLLQEMRDNRVYFYTGTHPASYTLNFMEAWMTAIPIVAIGPQHGNSAAWRNHNLYEIQDLIQNGVNGFVSDDPRMLTSHIQMLMNSDSLAQTISEEGRKSAIRHFGKDMISRAWDAYLKDLR